MSKNSLYIATSCALLISFFLPWVEFIISGSGYDIATQFSGQSKILWLVPISALIMTFSVLFRFQNPWILRATGILPWVIFIRVFVEMGTDVFRILAIGAYLALATGLVLCLEGFGLSIVPSVQSASRE